MNPTGPMKLSFRPNFQWQEPEPAPVRKQGKRPVQKADDLDTAGPAFPTMESGTEEESTVRKSTRRAAPRTKSSGLVPLHELSDDFELLDDDDDEVESNISYLSSKGNRHGRRTMRPPPPPPSRRRDETRQQQDLAADPDPDPDPDPDR